LEKYLKISKGTLALLGAALLLGTFGVWIKWLSQYFGTPSQVVVRGGFATLIIVLIMLVRKIELRVAKENTRFLVLFGIVFSSSILCMTYAANNGKVTNALFLLYVGSVLATNFWGKFVFREKMTADKVVSLILLMIGLVLFIHPLSLSSFGPAALFALAAGLLEGSSHALRKQLKNVTREIVVFVQSSFSVIVGMLVFTSSGEKFVKVSDVQGIFVGILFGFALVGMGYLLGYGFAHSEVSSGTVILSTELFFATIINFLFLREVPTLFEILGGLVIFAAATYTSWPPKLKLLRVMPSRQKTFK
jgi:drug/metabolite transporter (DMT)-like permease